MDNCKYIKKEIAYTLLCCTMQGAANSDSPKV